MSYDKAIRIRYQTAGIIQFGAAGETVALGTFRGPPGKKGVVRDIEVNVTETMVGTTEVPEITVGSAISTNNGSAKSVNAEYGRFRLGTTAAAGYATSTAVRRASALVNSKREVGASVNPGKQSLAYTGHVQLEKAYIPADTNFVITLLEGLDGSEAGAGIVAVEIDWI